MTFIENHLSFWVVLLLKRKSNAFHAFKNYKAYAENLFGQKILTFHNDKGGEYMPLKLAPTPPLTAPSTFNFTAPNPEPSSHSDVHSGGI
jgi:hypothetical protein